MGKGERMKCVTLWKKWKGRKRTNYDGGSYGSIVSG